MQEVQQEMSKGSDCTEDEEEPTNQAVSAAARVLERILMKQDNHDLVHQIDQEVQKYLMQNVKQSTREKFFARKK